MAEYRYNRNGMQAKVRFGNGLRTCYQYNSSNQLTWLKAGFLGQETILESCYQYDRNGNRVRKEEYQRGQPQSTQYQYDSQDRLTRESRDKSSTIYRYDAAGNRIQKEQDGTVETYRYDSRNRLLERTDRTKKVRYAYDAAGNLTQEQHERINTGGQTTQSEEIRYAYDTFGRATEVSGSTFQQKNRYDAEGFRYERKENEKASRFVYHRGIMLAELDERNQVTGSQCIGNGYIGGYLSERKEETIRSGQSDEKASISKETGKGFSSGSDVNFISKERELCYYIWDEQGSVRYVVDQSGNVVNEYQYRAFGETEQAEERYENRLCYNGQMYDGLTEQYYLRARYYQPKTGRFTQEDFLYEDGLNLYAYCKSNPVMYCDPSGLAGEAVINPVCETKKKAEGDGEPDLYHYTTQQGAEAIQSSGVIRPDDRGRVFVTTDQISAADVNNALLMGQKPEAGTHVVEITLIDKNDFNLTTQGATQPNELIYNGAIRNGRNALLNVKENDFK